MPKEKIRRNNLSASFWKKATEPVENSWNLKVVQSESELVLNLKMNWFPGDSVPNIVWRALNETPVETEDLENGNIKNDDKGYIDMVYGPDEYENDDNIDW